MSAVRSLVLGIFVACAGLSPMAHTAIAAQAPAGERDGQKDFDFEIGTWTTKVQVLTNPLSGAPAEWAQFEGTSIVRPLLDGRANFVELSIASADGKIEGGSLRLYNPKTRQWNVNYASLGNGTLTAPIYGAFDGAGKGTFYGQDTLDGRVIMVRFVITQASKDEVKFEQAYSADGGMTWATNWIAVDTRS
ncbi:hypothetical protein sos41_22690 [Alphaproteobacteria bacterium SO-S41]|nr:hypothetical protein sos41_22690 [Alphaproteobacteria bacterium SO-S41]